jgi:hypothetical protein
MPSESDSPVGALLGGNGSSALPASPPSEAEQSLIAAIHGLAHQLGETNVHLLVLADTTAKCLSHISLLLDLVLSNEAAEADEESKSYLDGSPVL